MDVGRFFPASLADKVALFTKPRILKAQKNPDVVAHSSLEWSVL